MSAEQVDSIYRVTDDKIEGFFREHRFLSNFHEYPLKYEGLIYGSAEAAYQAAKTLDNDIRERFTKLSPSQAKHEGQIVKLRDNWDSIKDQIMEDILFIKFTSCEDLKNQLLATGNRYLEETNWWGDRYWGRCNGHGQNKLGRFLIFIRSQIRETIPT